MEMNKKLLPPARFAGYNRSAAKIVFASKAKLIRETLLEAAEVIGPWNSGRCAGAALYLRELADDEEFVHGLV